MEISCFPADKSKGVVTDKLFFFVIQHGQIFKNVQHIVSSLITGPIMNTVET